MEQRSTRRSLAAGHDKTAASDGLHGVPPGWMAVFRTFLHLPAFHSYQSQEICAAFLAGQCVYTGQFLDVMGTLEPSHAPYQEEQTALHRFLLLYSLPHYLHCYGHEEHYTDCVLRVCSVCRAVVVCF